jgi:hypothetical protein
MYAGLIGAGGFVLTGCLLAPAFCQVPQDHPELCGKQAAAPPKVYATIDHSNGRAVLNIGPEHSLALPGINDEIQEVCLVGPSKWVVFGSTDVGY